MNIHNLPILIANSWTIFSAGYLDNFLNWLLSLYELVHTKMLICYTGTLLILARNWLRNPAGALANPFLLSQSCQRGYKLLTRKKDSSTLNDQVGRGQPNGPCSILWKTTSVSNYNCLFLPVFHISEKEISNLRNLEKKNLQSCLTSWWSYGYTENVCLFA